MKTKHVVSIAVSGLLLALSPVVLAKKDGGTEIKKDLVLDISESFLSSFLIPDANSDGKQINSGEGTIEFPEISFNTVFRNVLDTSSPDPVVDPGCPVGTALSIPFHVSQIWHKDGDGISLDEDTGLTNAVCVGSETGVILNLEVTGGTGAFACASGGFSVNTVGFPLPPELVGLSTSTGLNFNPTNKGKGVGPAADRSGVITIPASCP